MYIDIKSYNLILSTKTTAMQFELRRYILLSRKGTRQVKWRVPFRVYNKVFGDGTKHFVPSQRKN